MSYELYTARQLRAFRKNRDVAVSRRSEKNRLMKLETADEGGTFDRFLDLSPEMRTLVYSFLFDSVHVTAYHEHPSITQVSTLFHGPSLPLFYDIAPLSINIIDRDKNGLAASFCYIIPEIVYRFFKTVHLDRLHRIRKITIEATLKDRGAKWKQRARVFKFHWMIELPTNGVNCKIEPATASAASAALLEDSNSSRMQTMHNIMDHQLDWWLCRKAVKPNILQVERDDAKVLQEFWVEAVHKMWTHRPRELDKVSN